MITLWVCADESRTSYLSPTFLLKKKERTAMSYNNIMPAEFLCGEYSCEIEIDDFDDDCPRKSTTRKGEQTPMNDFRSYLTRRVENIYRDGKTQLSKNFFLTEEDCPNTGADLVKRIQDGDFQLPYPDTKTGLTAYGNGPYGIIWRNPKNIADPTGFLAAVKLLNVQRQKALDVINVLPEADSLAALQTFETYVESLTPAVTPAPAPVTETVTPVA